MNIKEHLQSPIKSMRIKVLFTPSFESQDMTNCTTNQHASAHISEEVIETRVEKDKFGVSIRPRHDAIRTFPKTSESAKKGKGTMRKVRRTLHKYKRKVTTKA
jgi:hypothetical protein